MLGQENFANSLKVHGASQHSPLPDKRSADPPARVQAEAAEQLVQNPAARYFMLQQSILKPYRFPASFKHTAGKYDSTER